MSIEVEPTTELFPRPTQDRDGNRALFNEVGPFTIESHQILAIIYPDSSRLNQTTPVNIWIDGPTLSDEILEGILKTVNNWVGEVTSGTLQLRVLKVYRNETSYLILAQTPSVVEEEKVRLTSAPALDPESDQLTRLLQAFEDAVYRGSSRSREDVEDSTEPGLADTIHDLHTFLQNMEARMEEQVKHTMEDRQTLQREQEEDRDRFARRMRKQQMAFEARLKETITPRSAELDPIALADTINVLSTRYFEIAALPEESPGRKEMLELINQTGQNLHKLLDTLNDS